MEKPRTAEAIVRMASDHQKRRRLLAVLALMPDEAFWWFVAWASGAMMQFPDGLGGFSMESRSAIADLRAAAEEFLGKGPAA